MITMLTMILKMLAWQQLEWDCCARGGWTVRAPPMGSLLYGGHDHQCHRGECCHDYGFNQLQDKDTIGKALKLAMMILKN